ncbi:MAG: AI-2E family transporter [Romboutsia sp.]|nr:AI-2E family transporter [Romboutsia sp.]
MKIEFNKKLFKYAVYIVLTAIILYIAFVVIFNIGPILKSILKFVLYIVNLLKPLLIGIIIAYLLYPITCYIENLLKDNSVHNIKSNSLRRAISIVFSYSSVVAIVLLLIWGIYFMIGGQISKNTSTINIISEIATYFSTTSFSESSIRTAIESFNSPLLNFIEPYIIDGFEITQRYIETNISSMASSIVAIGSSVASFFVGLIISIYLLKDSEYFISLWIKLYHLILGKSKTANAITNTFTIIHEVFGKFIHGQLLEAFFVGILSTISLSIAGIKYAFVIGAIAGISNMIPYVGPIVGTILAAAMGFLSGSPIKILYAIIAMIIVQQIDNHLLAPKIIGDSVGLHAVFTIMAIIIGGNVGGLLGMLIAVPLAASFKVLFNNWYNKHHNSSEKN